MTKTPTENKIPITRTITVRLAPGSPSPHHHRDRSRFEFLPIGLREISKKLAQSSAGHFNSCAGIPFGATEVTIFLNGFERQMLVRLLRAGLATLQRENLRQSVCLSAA
jgi:hypothetical protein